MPSVSVIIPAYNSARFIGLTIDSVLAQTYRDFEVIVVDDGSTDDTVAIVSGIDDPRVRCLRQKNRGAAAAQNTGYRQATGRYVTFLGADDLFAPRKLADQIAVLESHAQTGLVASGWTYIDEAGNAHGDARPWETFPVLDLHALLRQCPFIPQSSLIRKTWLDRVGGFDDELRRAEDWDLFLRLAHEGCPMEWLRHSVCCYRVRPDSLSSAVTLQKESGFLVLDKYFARLPADHPLQQAKPELYAAMHLRGVGREYAAGQFEEAKKDLDNAIRLDPSLAQDDGNVILMYLTSTASGPYVSDPDAFLDSVYDNLPDAARSVLPGKRRARAMLRMIDFYRACETDDRDVARRRFPAAALNDPRWIMNRGALRMWADSLLGRERIDRLLSPAGQSGSAGK